MLINHIILKIMAIIKYKKNIILERKLYIFYFLNLDINITYHNKENDSIFMIIA